MAKKNCVICGNEGHSYYPFCYKHLKEKNEGKLLKCDNCSNWFEVEKGCECQNKQNNIDTQKELYPCIICGELSNKNHCINCYKEAKEFTDNLDKNCSANEFRDHYYNLKDSIFRMINIDYVKKNANKLIAIAMLNKKVNSDEALSSRVYNDVEKLITDKFKTINKEPTEISQKKDAEREEKHRTQDGHYVESPVEVTIDDVLYNAMIPHAYGQPVNEISEKRKKSDWFIPIKGTAKGIYIEYWGMNTKKYLTDRKEKEELYIKNNVPYISIEKDDPKLDSQGFRNNLLREIREKAHKYYKTEVDF